MNENYLGSITLKILINEAVIYYLLINFSMDEGLLPNFNKDCH
jgi:hypothetical protein